MTGASTKTQKRKGPVAYIFCQVFQLSLIWGVFPSPSSSTFWLSWSKSCWFFFAVKDGEPDDVELSDIAEKIPQLWRKLGRILRVPRENLNELGINHRDDAYERAFQVLSSWKETLSDGAISRYQVLFDALTKIGRSDLAKKYCCYWSKLRCFEERKSYQPAEMLFNTF